MIIRKLAVYILFFVCVEILMPTVQTYAQGPGKKRDLIEFYGYADTTAMFPPSEDSLRVIRQKFLDGFHVSFIGFKLSPKVRIVAVTPQPIKNVKKDITLTAQFEGIYPRAGKVTSWGYIFDRNQDGKIDYLALLGGAAPYHRGDMPEDFPPRKVQLTTDQIEFMVSHCQLAFNYWADDNFDGKLDGLIQINSDPDRDWVQDQIVIRSTKFNDKFDDVWAFQYRIENRADSIEHSRNRVPYRPMGKPAEEITPKTFKDKSDILRLINRAAYMSGLKADDFIDGSEGVQ